MKLLLEGKDVTQDQKKITELRIAVNTWINNIKNHNLNNIGDNILISSVYYKPTYNIGLLTRYEKRILQYTSLPYKNQEIAKQEITSLAQVPRWDYELTKVTDVLPKSKIWKISGSEEVATCPTCSGKKKIKCPDCQNGKISCHVCHGKGSLTCTSCNGSGHRQCTSCGGRGYTESRSTKTRNKYSSYGEMRVESYTETTRNNCRSCNGTGRISCSACDASGHTKCSYCGGTGSLQCTTCHGSSYITCTTCAGLGQVMKFIQMENSFEDKYNIYSKTYSDLATNFPDLSNLCRNASGFSRFDESGTSFSKDFLSEYPYLSQGYNKLYNEKFPLLDQYKDGIRIIKQRLQVFEIPVYEVKYQFEGENYVMLVYGGKLQVYAPVSPLSKYADSVLEEAKRLFKLKKYSTSLSLINKSIKLDSRNNTKDVAELKEKILKCINRDYKTGSFLGLVLNIVFFAALIYFLAGRLYFIIPGIAAFYHRITTLSEVLPWVLWAGFTAAMFLFLPKNIPYTEKKIRDSYKIFFI